MTIGELIEACEAQGISLRPGAGGKLRVSPPPERLPGELVEALKRHKAEILATLSARPKPSLNTRGELIIPFDSAPYYHWWKPGGQSVTQTLVELSALPAVM